MKIENVVNFWISILYIEKYSMRLKVIFTETLLLFDSNIENRVDFSIERLFVIELY